MWNVPFAVLAVFFFTIPWQDSVQLPGHFAVSRIVGVLLIVAGLGSMVKGRSIKIRRPSLMLCLTILFVFWAGLSALWSINVSRSLFLWLTYVQLAVMVWLIWELCRTREQHLVLLQAFVLGAFVLAGSTAYEYLTNPAVTSANQYAVRYTGGLAADENVIASIMAFALPLAWYLSVTRRSGWLRWLNLIYLPVGILAIVLTASRGGAIIAVTGLAVIPLTYTHISRVRRVLLTVLFVVMAVALVNLVPPENVARLTETSSELTEGNVSNRSQIWEAGLEVYSDHPVLGVGVGGFSDAVMPILGYKQVAHNVFVNLLTEMGVVGVGLYTLMLLVILVPLLRLPSPDRTVYTFIWLALFISLLPSNDEDAQYTWALLALLTTRRAYVLTYSHSARLLAEVPAKLRRGARRTRSA